MRHLVFKIYDRMIFGIYATAAKANAARGTFGTADEYTAVAVPAANVPDGAEPGWYLTTDNMVVIYPVVLRPRLLAQALSRLFIAQVMVPYIEPALEKRPRWLREANLTEADITRAGSPTDKVKRVLQFDAWIGNAVLIPDVSFGELYAMPDETAGATVKAKETEGKADAAYSLNEVQLNLQNIVEFWYKRADLRFFNYELGDAWVTGRGAQLGIPISRHKLLVPSAGWNITVGFNNMHSRAFGL